MANLKAGLKSSFESALIRQLNQRESGRSGFSCSNKIVTKLEALVTKKVSKVS